MHFLLLHDVGPTALPGRLRLVRDGELLPDPVSGTPEVLYHGQGGLLEVAIHPRFVENRLLYLSYSKPSEDGSQGTTAVGRARFDGERLTDLSVGDRGANPLAGPRDEHPAQDPTNHQGTIVRTHDDGSVPRDNPFVGREDATFGFRRSSGLSSMGASAPAQLVQRYPTFLTVRRWRGRDGSGSSFRRSSETCVSTVRDSTGTA
jgi:aldose sugar dehydrogenase